jgi:ABC-2 type transport system ATP-binding protein
VTALSASGVTKRYTQHLALDEVSLNVPEKSIYGLLGPNGAGKTTLIRIINQIINADAGEITIFNERLNPKHIGVIGYLPEERGLYKKMKVGEQLLYLAQLKGLTKADALDKLKVWFTKFEIKDWWNKKVEDLSKGMAQKIQFVSTVLHQPRLIILDEPFSGFDPINAQLITNEILELRDKGSTIIFSTHRMETVEALCDHIALINKSRKILEGPKKQIKDAYKTNTFLVEHRGAFSLSSNHFELLEQHSAEENVYHSAVKIHGSARTNDLIRELVDKTEVYGIAEKIPTMSDIFISLVKEDPNH